MNNKVRFSAPWSSTVRIVTLIVVTLLLALAAISCFVQPEKIPMAARLAAFVLPLLVLFGTLLFVVQGYVVTDSELFIERFGWRNRIPLRDVVSVTIDPEAMRGSLRLCGSGGLFGFFGWFRNSKLGVYRAYCTDTKRCVILKLVNRTIVVSPDDPGRFVAEIRRGRALC
jgi:hypothetical protein